MSEAPEEIIQDYKSKHLGWKWTSEDIRRQVSVFAISRESVYLVGLLQKLGVRNVLTFPPQNIKYQERLKLFVLVPVTFTVGGQSSHSS